MVPTLMGQWACGLKNPFHSLTKPLHKQTNLTVASKLTSVSHEADFLIHNDIFNNYYYSPSCVDTSLKIKTGTQLTEEKKFHLNSFFLINVCSIIMDKPHSLFCNERERGRAQTAREPNILSVSETNRFVFYLARRPISQYYQSQ